MAKRPSKEEIDSYRATDNDNRTLAIGVNSEFLKLVNVRAAQRGISVREFVIESILLNEPK